VLSYRYHADVGVFAARSGRLLARTTMSQDPPDCPRRITVIGLAPPEIGRPVAEERIRHWVERWLREKGAQAWVEG
jgi:hypothetical protein